MEKAELLHEKFASDEEEETINPYENFLYALTSPEVKRQYPSLLKIFFDTINFEPDNPSMEERANLLYRKAISHRTWLESQIMRFVEIQKKRIAKAEIAPGTLKNYLKVVRLFCEMNRIDSLILWKKVKKGMPKVNEKANDRAPTHEEIRKLLEYQDMRITPIVLVMSSCGMRLQSWDFLKWKHIIPKRNAKGNLVAAKIDLFNTKNNRRYFSFITPEAYFSLKKWMDYRASYGEKITGESWLMRDIWQKTHVRYSHRIGLASEPEQLKSTAIKNMIAQVWQHVGVRGTLGPGEKRHEFKSVHGFRKFFETWCQPVMNHNMIKMLMDHSIAESGNYHKPTEAQLLEEYQKAVDNLTISQETKVNKQISELRQRDVERDYIIEGKMKEKDRQIEELTSKFERMDQEINHKLRHMVDVVTRRIGPDENDYAKKYIDWYLKDTGSGMTVEEFNNLTEEECIELMKDEKLKEKLNLQDELDLFEYKFALKNKLQKEKLKKKIKK